jgi:hypothetical protein
MNIKENQIILTGLAFSVFPLFVESMPLVQRLSTFVMIMAVSELLQLAYLKEAGKQPLTQEAKINYFAGHCLGLALLIVGLVGYSEVWQEKEMLELRMLAAYLALFLMCVYGIILVLSKRQTLSRTRDKEKSGDY